MKNIIALFLTITLLFTGTDLRVFAMCDNPVSVQKTIRNPKTKSNETKTIKVDLEQENYLRTRYYGVSGIHAPTGNYSQSFTDMTVPTVLGDLTFTRTYNSLNNEAGIVGRGFSFSYDMKVIHENNTAYVMLPNGSVWSFSENNNIFTALDSRGVLKKQSSDYVLETLDQMRYVFNSSGSIKYVEDFKGNRVTIVTNANGRILSLSDPAGANVTFGYTGNYLTSIVDNKSGRNVSYTYNNNLLTSVNDAGGFTTTYTYNNGLLTGINDNSGRRVITLTYLNSDGKVHTVTDVTGNTRTYTYDIINMQTIITDSTGRTTKQGYGFDYAVTVSVNELGYTERVNYLLIDSKNKFNEVQSTVDIYGNVTSYVRDIKGNITRINYPDGSNEQFTFDNLNNMTSHTDRSGAVTWYIYDGYNLVKEAKPIDGVTAYSTSANQNNYIITTYTYYPNNTLNKNGLVQTITLPGGNSNNYIFFEYNSIGEVMKSVKYIDGTPFITQYFYDNAHRITKQINPDNTVTDYVYNLAGQVVTTTVTSPNGQIVSVIETVYDNLGRVIKEISPIGGETQYFYNNAGFVFKQTDALGHSTLFEYDYYGNVTKQTLANNSVITLTYDSMNRKTSEKFNGVLLEEIVYSAVNRNAVVTTTVHIDTGLTAVTVERYNFEGNLIERIDPNGLRHNYSYVNGRLISETHGHVSVTSYTYDNVGRIVKVTSSFDTTSTSETLYVYDNASNMTAQFVQNNAPGQNKTYSMTEYEYDAWGRNTLVIYYDQGTARSSVGFVYDWADRVIEQHKGLDTNRSIVKYQYDHFGNITKKTDAMNQEETFTYDNAGRLVSSADRNGTLHTITYDLMDNPLTKSSTDGTAVQTKTYTYDVMGNLLTVNDGSGVITYTYNGRGNRLTETRGNTVKTYTYNNIGSLTNSVIKIGNVVQQNVSYEYNNIGRITKVFEDNSLVTSYSYDIFGRQIKAVNANGTVQTTRYNTAGLVVNVKNTVGKATISEYTYTYYYDGNQRTKKEFAGTTYYLYDGLNRLTTAILPDGTVQEYEFDDNSNRTSLTVTQGGSTSITTYTYDKNDRLTSETADGITTVYAYDFNGNMLSKSGGTVYVVQVFDLLNRMTSWTNGVSTAVYDYNPDNMRRSKTVDGVTTTHIWIGTDIAVDITGGNVVNYIHGRRGVVKSDYGWYVFNAHGDVVQLTNGFGTVTKFYDYDPYGNQLTGLDSFDNNPYRYNGQYYDTESGYVYLRARYYDTSTGRFISEDPAFDGYNWYNYAAGNPIMYHDPSGLFFKQLYDFGYMVGKNGSGGSTLYDFGRDLYTYNNRFIKHDVPVYNQGDTSLCWAYSQVMVESFQDDTKLKRNEADARAKELAVSLYGEVDWNRGGRPTNEGVLISVDNIGGLWGLHDIIIENGPVYAVYDNRSSGNEWRSHMVVITGVDSCWGTVHSNNPWGFKGEQTYKEFEEGFVKKWYHSNNDMTLQFIVIPEPVKKEWD